MQLFKGLVLSEENVTNMDFIQKKIVLTFTLLTFFLLILLGISDAIIGLSKVIVWVKIVLSFPYLLAYFLVLKYSKTQLAVQIMLIVGHLVIFCNFFYNDGSNGPTMYGYFLMLVVYTLLVKGWLKVLWFIGSLTSFFLLFYLEAYGYIEVQKYYTSTQNTFIDHAVTIAWISIFVFVVLHYFIKSYQNQNQVLNSIKQRQEQTLEEVKTLNDQKNKLIAILSHDLKNPIGMLHMTLGMVEKGVFEPGEMEQILRNLRAQSFHLNKVLNNTLSWVMTELEDKPVQLHQISLTELTQEMKEMMVVQATEKNQIIEVSVEGEDRNISLEINEIKIVLKNLLDNAINLFF
mgnify:FL=1